MSDADGPEATNNSRSCIVFALFTLAGAVLAHLAVSRVEFDGNVLRAPYESYLIPPAVLLTVTGMLGLAACGMAAFVRKTCEWSQRQDRFPRR